MNLLEALNPLNWFGGRDGSDVETEDLDPETREEILRDLTKPRGAGLIAQFGELKLPREQSQAITQQRTSTVQFKASRRGSLWPKVLLILAFVSLIGYVFMSRAGLAPHLKITDQIKDKGEHITKNIQNKGRSLGDEIKAGGQDIAKKLNNILEEPADKPVEKVEKGGKRKKLDE